ncbi:MAG: epoxide hydrolase, soluble (sEH) [Alyxoria varia]|nr:MAG: epoxide hydrolase, soluble (sEH) [Alyxoria varia]
MKQFLYPRSWCGDRRPERPRVRFDEKVDEKAVGEEKGKLGHGGGSPTNDEPVNTSFSFLQAVVVAQQLDRGGPPSVEEMDEPPAFETFDHGAKDLVLAVDHNFYGDRMVVAAADHCLRVYDKDSTTNKWKKVDEWRAHDAEVTDVKWAGPWLGQMLASISEDGLCKLWYERPEAIATASPFPENNSNNNNEDDYTSSEGGDSLSNISSLYLTAPAYPASHHLAFGIPTSGRRFRLIPAGTIPSKSILPWMSISVLSTNVGRNLDTIIGLVARDGNFSVCSMRDATAALEDSEWRDWMDGSNFYVTKPVPRRSEEGAFHVSFHQDPMPVWTAVEAGLPRQSVGVAVAAMNVVKVYRTDGSKRLYLAATCEAPSMGLIRGMSWGHGSARGFDVIAAAGKDGYTRIWELRTIKREPSARDLGMVIKDSGTTTTTVQQEKTGTAQTHRSNTTGKAPATTARQQTHAYTPYNTPNLSHQRSTSSNPEKPLSNPSTLSANLSGASGSASTTGKAATSSTSKGAHASYDPMDPTHVRAEARLVFEEQAHAGTSAWRVGFSMSGAYLSSAGDDGRVVVFGRSPADGKWQVIGGLETEQKDDGGE